MPCLSPRTFCTTFVLCLPATGALADLTAAEVWDDWKAYMASAGYELSLTETRGAGEITLSDLTMRTELGEDAGDGVVDIDFGTVRFVEQGDGTVAIELTPQNEIAMEFAPEEGETVNVTVSYTQTDHSMIASGDPSALTYSYDAAAIAMSLSSLTVDGTPIGQDVAKFDITMTDVAYVTETGVDVVRSIAQTMSAAGLGYDLRFADPEGEGSVDLKGAMQGVAFAGAGALPLDTDTQDLNAMLNDGFAFGGTFSAASGNYDMSFSGPDGAGTVNSTSQGAELEVAMGPEGLTYDVLQRDVAMNVLMTEFPLPLSFSAAEIGTGIQMPLQKSPDEQGFGLVVTLRDFAVSDMIWGLVDPQGQLPRDPATLVVDLSGTAKVLFDFLDPAQATVLEQTGAMPGELNTLSLNALTLDVAGAKLTGSGDFTFDNSDLTTFDGVPRPEGALDLSLVGGNGLLDKLVNMGLVPQDQAMGARMMMGLFAVPGAGADTLNSKIEVNGEGHVLANGQRIR